METEKLIIRYFTENDYNDFCLLIRDKMNGEYKAYDNQLPVDDNGLYCFLDYCINSKEFLAVEKKDSKIVIGFISINKTDDETRNLGYTIRSDYQNNGYATEAIKKVIEYAKNNLNVKKLIAGTAENNIPSIKLLTKMGFQLVNKSKGAFTKDEFGNPIEFIGCSFIRYLNKY